MMKEQYDVLVIGAGGAGMTAALQASELGASVAVLEKEAKAGGNTNRASSGMNAAESDVQLQHRVTDSIRAPFIGKPSRVVASSMIQPCWTSLFTTLR